MARWIDRNALTPAEHLRLWLEDQVLAFRSLCGRSVTRWVGTEMPVREVGPSGVPVFHDPEIPYLQVCPLYLEFDGGGGGDIHTYQNNWPEGWGLCIDPLYGGAPADGSEEGGIFRTRALDELPIGQIEDVCVIQDDNGDIVKVTLQVESAQVGLWSGEVHEEASGLRVVMPDESVLVAVQVRLGDN